MRNDNIIILRSSTKISIRSKNIFCCRIIIDLLRNINLTKVLPRIREYNSPIGKSSNKLTLILLKLFSHYPHLIFISRIFLKHCNFRSSNSKQFKILKNTVLEHTFHKIKFIHTRIDILFEFNIAQSSWNKIIPDRFKVLNMFWFTCQSSIYKIRENFNPSKITCFIFIIVSNAIYIIRNQIFAIFSFLNPSFID